MFVRLTCAVALAFTVATVAAQTPPKAPAPVTPPTEVSKDPLGRTSPRGTVLGFLNAARNGDYDLARHYLETPLTGRGAEELARQLFVVLDTLLPARLTQVSDEPDGSRANPLAPDEDHVGTIEAPDGPIEITVRRVKPPKGQPVWLFASSTLAEVPPVYEVVQRQHEMPRLPRFLTEHRIGRVRLAEWLAILLGLPLFYFAAVLLNRLLTPPFSRMVRRTFPRFDGAGVNAIPMPARLLLVCLAGQWLFSSLALSLLVRQLLTNAAAVVTILAVTWLVLLANAEAERVASRRIASGHVSAGLALLRVGRRLLDVLIVMVGVLVTLRRFGVDPTPLLAGLGVGGIAVALAAQKTLENVIAGASLIFDQAVRVGDFLKVGEVEGTVEHIGLRSTRIRTMNRSVVSVPNSQIASMSLETLSARDKFWFHPVIGLRYETTTDQMRIVLDGIRSLLMREAVIDGASVRVRLLHLGAFSLDVEVFAYVLARDWPHFLEVQEELLLRITEIVTAAGTGIAFPSQTMYVEQAAASSVDAAQVR